MKRRLFLVPLVVLMAVSLILSGCSTPEPATPEPSTPEPSEPAPVQPIVLKFSSGSLLDSYDGVFLDPWLDSIEEASDGRIEIERHWAGTLVALPDAYQATIDGVVDIAHIFPTMVAGQFTMDEYEYLPPMDHLTWRPSRIYWELYESFPEMQAQYSMVKIIGHSSDVGAFLTTPKKLINSLADFKGLKVTATGQTPALRQEAFGMTPVALAPGEVYTALEKGLVDVHVLPLKNLFAYNWGELMTYLYNFKFTTHSHAYIMNVDKWNELPDDLKAVFDDLGGMSMADMSDQFHWSVHHDCYGRATSELGLEIIDFSEEAMAELQEADKVAVGQYIAGLEERGLPGQKLVDEYLKLDEKYSAPEYALE